MNPLPDDTPMKTSLKTPYGRSPKSREATTKAPRLQARRNKQKAARAARRRNRKNR